jgi:pseudaminic acid cytidylyltransferase
MNIAIIPARAGSKRIPNKNIKLLQGIPVIAYAIKLARETELFSNVYVSTDSLEIAEIATSHGALVPNLRAPHLSDDYATTLSVISDFVANQEFKHSSLQNICCIYPVTPLLKPERIIEAHKILVSNDYDYVFSAKYHETSLLRSFQLDQLNRPAMVSSLFEFTRSQDLPELYHDAGQFYWGTKTAWESETPIFSGNSSVTILDKWETIDVDTLDDWSIVEGLLSLRSK